MKLSLFLISSLFIWISCANKDEPKSIYDSYRVLECHNEKTWGLEETKSNIIGQWEWKHAEYIYGVPPDNSFEGMKIEFRDDLTGTLTKNEVDSLEFTWSIQTNSIYFGFSTEPVITQLNGQILFCGNLMLCGIAGSEIADGVNNYFQKIQ